MPDPDNKTSTGDMRADWNARADLDFRHAVYSNTHGEHGEERFVRSGQEEARDILQRLPTRDVAGWKVLEYGSGVGRLMEPLSQSFRELHGVDISDRMVEIGRQRLAGRSNVGFAAITPEGRIPHDDKSFDCVYSSHVFMHIPKGRLPLVLVEIARVLKPGGLFLFHLTYPYTLRRKLKALRHDDKDPTDTYRRRYYTSRRIRSMLAERHLVLQSAERETPPGKGIWYLAQREG